MRTIARTNQLKRDYKRELKGRHRLTLGDDFRQVVGMLVSDQPLPERYYDHTLTGNWKDFRDCHIKPDQLVKMQYKALNPVRISLFSTNAVMFKADFSTHLIQ